MKTKQEINKLIKHLNKNNAHPINGHIFVVPYEDNEAKEEVRGGIYIPTSSLEKNGSGMFVKVVVVSFCKESKALETHCLGQVEFEIGDICYGVSNTLTHRECYVDGEKIFCIDPHQLVAVLGRVS